MIEWTSEASSTLTVDLGSQGIELKEAGTPVDVLLPAASYGGFAVTIYDTKNGVMLNEKLLQSTYLREKPFRQMLPMNRERSR